MTVVVGHSAGKINTEVVMAKGIKIPKRIAGVKIPKSVRKGPISDFINSSGGQLLLAEALLAIGSVYVARRADPDGAVGDTLRHPIDSVRSLLAGNGFGSRGALDRDRMRHAFGSAIRAFRDELQRDTGPASASTPDEEEDIDRAAVGAADESFAKKKPFTRRTRSSRHGDIESPH